LDKPKRREIKMGQNLSGPNAPGDPNANGGSGSGGDGEGGDSTNGGSQMETRPNKSSTMTGVGVHLP